MTDSASAVERAQPSPAAMTSLVLGVASLLLPVVAGVPAMLLGYRTLYAINASDGRQSGRRLAIAGMVLGSLTTVAGIAGFIILIFVNLSQRSRVVECENNLRRLGLALNVYHDTTAEKTFPPAAIPNPNLAIGDRLSWHTAILPYLDQEHATGKKWQRLSEQIDRKRAWHDAANAEAANTTLAVLLCPNHPTYDPAARPAPTHFVGISGVGADAAERPRGDRRAGFFGYERVLRRLPRDLPAGISHTLMVLETASDNGPWIAAGFPTARGVPDGERLIGQGAPFGGCHSGGMNALYVDGSVRFESDKIEPRILRDLARLERD